MIKKGFVIFLKKLFLNNDFIVETAYDLWEAGKKTAQFQPAIMILDITLPGINGLEVCKVLCLRIKLRILRSSPFPET